MMDALRPLPAEGFPLAGEVDRTVDNLGPVGAGTEGVLRRQRRKAPGLSQPASPVPTEKAFPSWPGLGLDSTTL